MKDIDGYVAKDDLYRLISHIKRNPDNVVNDETCHTIVNAISDMPSTDVQSVERGRWIEKPPYKTSELNKRIDDAFTELDTHRHRMNGLTREDIELKHELLRLREEYKFKLLILCIILGIMCFLWLMQIIFNICIST